MNNKPSSILVMTPSWVGDVVMATPVFRSLRETFREAHITAAIRSNPRPVIDDSPWFDEVVEITGRDLSFMGTLRLARGLRTRRHDLGVLLPNSFRTAITMRLARTRRIVGYSRDARGFLLHECLKAERDERGRFVPISMVDYYLGICRHLGCDVSSEKLELFYSDDVACRFDEYSRRLGIDWSKRVVVMNPGASFGASKCWPVEHFARCADTLCENPDIQVVVICAPAERELARAVADQAESKVVSLDKEPAGLDLLKVLIDRADLLVTNDTGPRHYAAAFNTPVVTIFGSTDPRWSCTRFAREVTLSIDVECAPCQLKFCPVDHRCMRWLKPEMVADASLGLLAKFPKTSLES